MPTRIRKKVVVVGDGACGKTSLLIAFAQGRFEKIHVPTVFETRVADLFVDDVHTELALWDTAGQEEYERLRPLSYPDSDVVLICFDISAPDSLANVTELWYPEVTYHCRGVPFLLVGCKHDLRTDRKTIKRLSKAHSRPTSYEEGLLVAQSIHAWQYLECSAKTGEGVRAVFEDAVRASKAVVVDQGCQCQCVIV